MTLAVPNPIIFNLFCLIFLLTGVLLFKEFAKPFRSGFFCDDESINKPVKDPTISCAAAIVGGILIPVFAIMVIELPKFCEMRKDKMKPFYKSHW